MPSSETQNPKKNDIAWQHFFDKSRVLKEIEKHGLAVITAKNLKLLGNREPRLMAKLDTTNDRPRFFKQNKLNILPVKNGEYVVYRDEHNKSYFEFDLDYRYQSAEQYTATFALEALDSFPILSSLSCESQVIDTAFLTSLLHHFCECDELYLTIRGRMFSGEFQIILPTGQAVNIANVQIELDSGFESHNSIILIESKIGRRTDFNIRQLVYPYLHWKKRSLKEIRPILLTYSNGEYTFTEFSIGTIYGDIRIVRNKTYVINDCTAALVNLKKMYSAIPVAEEPNNIPFPQADDMDKIVDLVKYLEFAPARKADIAEFFEFHGRQSDYYSNAAAYLGFVEKLRNETTFIPTQLGHRFLQLRTRTQRTQTILQQLLKRPIFRRCIQLLELHNFDVKRVDQKVIEYVISSECNVSESTLIRRAATARAWLTWLTQNVVVTDGR